MKKSGLNDIVSMLSEREFNDFGHFINNPLLNVPARIKELFEYIKKNYEEIKKNSPERDTAGRIVLGDEYSDDSLRKLFSNFIKEIYRFMSFAEFIKDENYAKILLLRQLRERGLSSNFSQKLNETKKYFETIKDDEERSKYLHQVYLMEFESELQSEFHKYSPALQKLSDMLDYNYMIQKLYHYQLMFSKQYLNREDIGYNKMMFSSIESYVINNETAIKLNFPEIYLKYIMLKLTEFKDDKMVSEYESFLESCLNRLSHEKAVIYYSDLYNLLTIRISRGEVSLRKVFLDLVKKLDAKNLVADSGTISYYSFKQITDTCIFLKDTPWLEYFLDKYKDMLDDVKKKNIINLAYSKLYYYKNDTDKARTSLAKVDYLDFIHYLDANLMLACIEFDAENYIEVLTIIENVKKYIRKHKQLTADMTESNLRFTKFLSGLVKIMEEDRGERKYSLDKLKNELENESRPVYARAWLYDVINKLTGI